LCSALALDTQGTQGIQKNPVHHDSQSGAFCKTSGTATGIKHLDYVNWFSIYLIIHGITVLL
jgi:hypothetical protein